MTTHAPGSSLPATVLQVIGRYLAALGVLRLALVAISLFTMVLAPGANAPEAYEGFDFFRTVLLPTIAPLCLAGLTFDALMSKVVMGDADEAGRLRLRTIIRTELVVALLLLIAWVPFFMTIGE
ncbi:MAG: hypothetical protein WED00_07620 [Aquisalimonadaceae bacterium]